NAILLFMFKGAFIYSPSFGFIIGFIVAMIFASQNPALENGWKVLTIRAIVMNIIIFLCGLTYMYLALNFLLDSPITWMQTLMSGMIIFLPTDIIKNVAAISLALVLKKRLELGKRSEEPRLNSSHVSISYAVFCLKKKIII